MCPVLCGHMVATLVCKHSWLPPVAAQVNSSLPADMESSNRIAYTAAVLIWLWATLGFMAVFVREISVAIAA